MTTLASTVIQKVIKNFRFHDSLDFLAASITDSDTQITLTKDYSVGERTILEIDSELVFVTAWDPGSFKADVVRGVLGTTAAAHTSGTAVAADPRALRSDILDLFNMCLVELFPTLYQVDADSLSYNQSTIGYEISADAHDILSVYGEVSSTAKHWEPLGDWQKATDQDTSEFTSGKAIMLRTALPHGADIRVIYTKPFTLLTSESQDLEATAGLEDYMTDLPYYFAMSRLLVTEEVERSQSNAAQNHQRAQDVPGFLALRTGEWYQARYNDLKATCYARLIKNHKKAIGGTYGG